MKYNIPTLLALSQVTDVHCNWTAHAKECRLLCPGQSNKRILSEAPRNRPIEESNTPPRPSKNAASKAKSRGRSATVKSITQPSFSTTDAGFARFLKEHSSPKHQRVTAGGRIVPMDPPHRDLPNEGVSEHRASNNLMTRQEGLGLSHEPSNPSNRERLVQPGPSTETSGTGARKVSQKASKPHRSSRHEDARPGLMDIPKWRRLLGRPLLPSPVVLWKPLLLKHPMPSTGPVAVAPAHLLNLPDNTLENINQSTNQPWPATLVRGPLPSDPSQSSQIGQNQSEVQSNDHLKWVDRFSPRSKGLILTSMQNEFDLGLVRRLVNRLWDRWRGIRIKLRHVNTAMAFDWSICPNEQFVEERKINIQAREVLFQMILWTLLSARSRQPCERYDKMVESLDPDLKREVGQYWDAEYPNFRNEVLQRWGSTEPPREVRQTLSNGAVDDGTSSFPSILSHHLHSPGGASSAFETNQALGTFNGSAFPFNPSQPLHKSGGAPLSFDTSQALSNLNASAVPFYPSQALQNPAGGHLPLEMNQNLENSSAFFPFNENQALGSPGGTYFSFNASQALNNSDGAFPFETNQVLGNPNAFSFPYAMNEQLGVLPDQGGFGGMDESHHDFDMEFPMDIGTEEAGPLGTATGGSLSPLDLPESTLFYDPNVSDTEHYSAPASPAGGIDVEEKMTFNELLSGDEVPNVFVEHGFGDEDAFPPQYDGAQDYYPIHNTGHISQTVPWNFGRRIRRGFSLISEADCEIIDETKDMETPNFGVRAVSSPVTRSRPEETMDHSQEKPVPEEYASSDNGKSAEGDKVGLMSDDGQQGEMRGAGEIGTRFIRTLKKWRVRKSGTDHSDLSDLSSRHHTTAKSPEPYAERQSHADTATSMNSESMGSSRSEHQPNEGPGSKSSSSSTDRSMASTSKTTVSPILLSMLSRQEDQVYTAPAILDITPVNVYASPGLWGRNR